MKKSYKKGLAISALVAFLAVTATQPAMALGSNNWTVTPGGCNTGTFYGESNWLGASRQLYAKTTESGNFCWAGNHKVSSALMDNWNNSYSNVWAANVATSYYPLQNYNAQWRGVHSWGDSTGRFT